MRATLFAAGLVLATSLIVQPAEAQRVSADIIVGSGPVSGRVILGRPAVRHYPRRAVVVDRYVPRRYVVQRHVVRRSRGRGHAWGHFKGLRQERGYRAVRVYWDDRHDSYYDRPAHGLREITIYERDGRYYRDWDGDRDRWDD